MAITAAMVKELRELTGAGMMDCKKALAETDGNMEAAVETAKQLRLRNISGIIIVDFIDMKMEADKLDVLSTLNKELKKDPVKATLVDMTKLNLAEVTRKKVKKSLREQLGSYDHHRN